jgi:hypothetical protein
VLLLLYMGGDMTNPEEVSRMMYEALKLIAKDELECGCEGCANAAYNHLQRVANGAIQLYEQSITVDLEREEYERGEVESAQSIAFNKESR